jgi:hypothetical protein
VFETFADLPLKSLRSLTIDNLADPKSLVHIAKLSDLRQLTVRQGTEKKEKKETSLLHFFLFLVSSLLFSSSLSPAHFLLFSRSSSRSIADWEFFLSIPPGESQNSWPSPIAAGLHHIRSLPKLEFLPKLEKLCLKQVRGPRYIERDGNSDDRSREMRQTEKTATKRNSETQRCRGKRTLISLCR